MDDGRRRKIIIISILLHVLFLALWEAGIILDLFSVAVAPKPPESGAPIVLDLQQPPENQPPRQVIETPDDARVTEKQDKAELLSDKNALARNPEPRPELPRDNVDNPFSRGDLETHEIPKPEGPVGKGPPTPVQPETREPEQKEQPPEEEPEPEDAPANIQVPQKKVPSVSPGGSNQPPIVRHRSLDSSVDEMGGLSFNTYDWDFAPYMLMLKRRIQRNIFPPEAFKFGMINGDTLLRFKIYPDGVLRDLAILDYKGHESLMITSRNAIEISAPYPPLPTDFPEEYLEVTGKFIYFVRR